MIIRHGLLSISQIFTIPFMFSIMLIACSHQHNEFKSPPRYDLDKPYIIKLPPELDEISGITYYAKDNSIFAESDAKGCIYKIFLNKPTDIRKWKFSHKRDYEDIVLLDSVFYVLNNDGDIVSVSFDKDSLITHEYNFPEVSKNEFETLYYDDQLRKLVLICKDCSDDNRLVVSSCTFDPKESVYAKSYIIDAGKLDKLMGPNTTRFKPSGAAINPATGELYIISSVNKLLVVVDRNGIIKEAYRLNPKIFNQPEGIAFTPSGNLFISNEAGNMKLADILYYQYKKE
jgi:uncharacterized protein YjiK